MLSKILTKRNILLALGSLTALLLLIDRVGRVRLCGGDFFHGFCANAYFLFIDSAIFIIPTFVFCLIVYKMRDEIFWSWAKFAAWFVPVSILIISSASASGNSYVFQSDQEVLTMLLVPSFIIISLGIILWKWHSLRGK